MKNADETKEYSHKESHAPLKEKEIKVLEFNQPCFFKEGCVGESIKFKAGYMERKWH